MLSPDEAGGAGVRVSRLWIVSLFAVAMVAGCSSPDLTAAPKGGYDLPDDLCDRLDYKLFGLPGPGGKDNKNVDPAVADRGKIVTCSDKTDSMQVILVASIRTQTTEDEALRIVEMAAGQQTKVDCPLAVTVSQKRCYSSDTTYYVYLSDADLEVRVSIGESPVSDRNEQAGLDMAQQVVVALRKHTAQ